MGLANEWSETAAKRGAAPFPAQVPVAWRSCWADPAPWLVIIKYKSVLRCCWTSRAFLAQTLRF